MWLGIYTKTNLSLFQPLDSQGAHMDPDFCRGRLEGGRMDFTLGGWVFIDLFCNFCFCSTNIANWATMPLTQSAASHNASNLMPVRAVWRHNRWKFRREIDAWNNNKMFSLMSNILSTSLETKNGIRCKIVLFREDPRWFHAVKRDPLGLTYGDVESTTLCHSQATTIIQRSSSQREQPPRISRSINFYEQSHYRLTAAYSDISNTPSPLSTPYPSPHNRNSTTGACRKWGHHVTFYCTATHAYKKNKNGWAIKEQ